MRQFWEFLRKELLQILRDKRTMLILLLLPIIMVLLFGYAITTEVKDTRVAIYDPLHSANTERLTAELAANPYFILTQELKSPAEADQLFQEGKIDIALILSPDLDRQWKQPTEALLQIQSDATEPNQAQTRVGQIQQAIVNYKMQMADAPITLSGMPVSQMLFNPQMKGEYNFVPGLIGMLMLLICAMMSSIAIVREKEMGTMEILLASPLNPAIIVLAKLVPYFLVSTIDLALILILSVTVLSVPINGSLLVILGFCLLYILLSLSLGLLVSTLVDSQMTAMLICGMVFLMPTILLSGLMYPLDSMPVWLQYVANVTPARWFMDAIRRLMIQGVSIRYVWKEILVLSGMTALFMTVAIKKFKVRLE